MEGLRRIFEPQRRKDAKLIEPTVEDNAISGQVVDAALAVHRTLGPGLLESVYEQCLAIELGARSISLQRQVALPLIYRNTRIDGGLRMDMVVEGAIVVEVKAIERLLPIHEAQLLTYLKLSGCRLGLLINFNVVLIKDGIRRLIRSS